MLYKTTEAVNCLKIGHIFGFHQCQPLIYEERSNNHAD